MPKTIYFQRVFQLLILVIGAVFVGAVLVVAILRLGYPYELEWMEGGSLQIVQRIMAGQPVYTVPSVNYVPFIYSPLYFYLAAGFSFVVGDGFLPLRLVSVLAWVASLGLIFQLVKHRTEGQFWPFVGVALFAACFEIGGGWFDLARVDSLYLFFLLLAIYLLDLPQTKPRHTLAGAAFVLAFLTKQSGLLAMLPVLLWVLVIGRGWERWLMPVVAAGGVAVSVLVLNLLTVGWFNFYVFKLPATHEIAWPLVVEFWRFDVLAPLPFALLALMSLLVVRQWEVNGEDRDRKWLLLLAVAFIGSAYFSRLHAGGWNNVLLPAYAILAIILAATAGQMFHSAGPHLRLVLYSVILLQFSLLIFDPRDHLPTAADRLAGDQLVDRLAQSTGPVWLPHHSYLAVRAGHGPTAHAMAIEDVLRGNQMPLAELIDQQMRQDIREGRWELIVLDGPDFDVELAGLYGEPVPAFRDTAVFWTVTGLRTRPELVYRKGIP